MKNGKVSIIIPVYNEEKTLEETLLNLQFKWIKEIIIVNDGSTDNSLNIIKEFPVKLINLKKNYGKGDAVNYGLKWADGEIIMLVDADLGKSVKEIKKLIYPLENNMADMVIAIIPIKAGGLGIVRKIADKGLKIFTGKTLKVPLSGQRAFKREIINHIIPLSPGFGMETGMNIDALNSSFRIKEIPCDIEHRVTGHSFKDYYHRGIQLIAIIKTILNKIFFKNKT